MFRSLKDCPNFGVSKKTQERLANKWTEEKEVTLFFLRHDSLTKWVNYIISRGCIIWHGGAQYVPNIDFIRFCNKETLFKYSEDFENDVAAMSALRAHERRHLFWCLTRHFNIPKDLARHVVQHYYNLFDRDPIEGIAKKYPVHVEKMRKIRQLKWLR